MTLDILRVVKNTNKQNIGYVKSVLIDTCKNSDVEWNGAKQKYLEKLFAVTLRHPRFESNQSGFD